jgi:uncharacterized protein YceH (UPF0502 family)
MAPFKTIGEVEEALGALMQHDPPLVTKLPRESGRKESRYAHLFSPEATEEKSLTNQAAGFRPVTQTSEAISRLEEEISQIRRELEELRQAFAQFKSQF